ncbi:hypothetical protein ABE65_018780 [Fictibacillus phosphorivorans]|uniref:Uncharacterized protein n=1 Tax=Fictibacillus phosphorivorans TaxID=1221500 RepID=A0A160IRX9_9BACL|nr:hypothetical protein [Fictibacillus phosphorivorans]ANC78732.1 hypothetical protein ABE65_018780 [Fictibacillus phosphorivorans]
MEESFGKRKIFATILTSFLFSLNLTVLSVFDRETGESGLEIIMIPIFASFIAAGVIVCIGLITSAIIEFIICKIGWNYNISVPMYIVSHAAMGLLIGRLIFGFWGLYTYTGGLCATVFASIDMWLLFRVKKGKGTSEEILKIYLWAILTVIVVTLSLFLFVQLF